MEKTKFEQVLSINVNDKTEKKNGLTYLSWSWSWAEFKKIYPEATYSVKKDEKGLPYFYDENLGYMVFTEVDAENIKHEMWLPVMDGANKAMKNKPYKYSTKYGEKTVEQASMFDINKTIMRCLVKNLAMFGLGLYIYSGEDLPEDEKKEEVKQEPAPELTPYEKVKKLIAITRDIDKLIEISERIAKGNFTEIQKSELINAINGRVDIINSK
jgi:hypothetical protein